MTDIKTEVEKTIERCKKYILEGKENPTMALVYTPGSKRINVVPILTMDDRSKEASHIMLKMAVSELDADAVILVTEGWALEMPKETPIEDVLKSSPSKSPDRIEVLVVEGKTRTETLSFIAKITRGDDGIDVSEMKGLNAIGATSDSRFTKDLWQETTH